MAQTNVNIRMEENLKKQAIDDVNNERNLSGPFHSVAELMEDLNA